jgi:putative endonuclease
MIRRADGALYTGIALDVNRRFAQHVAGKGAKALRGRGPLELVLRRVVGARNDALRLERSIKCLAKPDKESLLVQRASVTALARSVRQHRT